MKAIWHIAVVSVALVWLPAEDAQDAVLVAAQKALAAGQPTAALLVLTDHPAQERPTQVRLLQARALLTLGRTQEASQRLGVSALAQLASWPEPLRGAVAAVVGEITLSRGELTAARPWLEQALRVVGEGVEIDRTAVLLAECCERSGDLAAAQRYAHLVWRDWPRSSYRAQAGVIEARLLAKTQPEQARIQLAGVRVLDRVEPGTRLMAAELLCQLLLPTKPGQCLVVAEQEMQRLPSRGRLALYHALALASLDPVEGLHALEKLEPHLRDEPAAQSTLSRLRLAPANAQQDVTLRIERARAELELGRPQPAQLMLEPLAATQPAALILLASIDEVALDPWMETPAMRDVGARAAVAIALSRRGDHRRAWSLFEPLVALGAAPVAGIPPASLLYWSAQSAQRSAPEHAPRLIAQLLAREEEGVESGMTWAEEAQRRERSGVAATEVRMAWGRSAMALPRGHPWQAIAALRAARPLVENGEGYEEAISILERIPTPAVGDDQQRCRFLLAQLYERLGRVGASLQVITELRPTATPEQGEKLERMRVRLESARASEVQKGPLDAEN